MGPEQIKSIDFEKLTAVLKKIKKEAEESSAHLNRLGIVDHPAYLWNTASIQTIMKIARELDLDLNAPNSEDSTT